MNKYSSSTITPVTNEYINNRGPLKGKVNSLVNKYESQEDTKRKHGQEFEKSSAVNTWAKRRTSSTERQNFLNSKSDIQFRNRANLRDTHQDSVVLARLVPNTEPQAIANNTRGLKHSGSLDDMLSCSTTESSPNEQRLICVIDNKESITRPINDSVVQQNDAVKSPSRVRDLQKLFVGDNKETCENTQLNSSFHSVNYGHQTPRSPATPRERRHTPLQLCSKLDGGVDYVASPRSSHISSNVNTALNLEPVANLGSRNDILNRSRSRTRSNRTTGETDDSWIKHRSRSVPANTELQPRTKRNDFSKEYRQSNNLTPRDTVKEGHYLAHGHLQNGSRHSKRSSWSYQEPNIYEKLRSSQLETTPRDTVKEGHYLAHGHLPNGSRHSKRSSWSYQEPNIYEKLQSSQLETNFQNSTKLLEGNKNSSNYEQLQVNQDNKSLPTFSLPIDENSNIAKAKRRSNNYEQLQLNEQDKRFSKTSSVPNNPRPMHDKVGHGRTLLHNQSQPMKMSNSLNQKEIMSQTQMSNAKSKAQIPDISTNGPDYENVPNYYKGRQNVPRENVPRDNKEESGSIVTEPPPARKMQSDYMRNKPPKGTLFDATDPNNKLKSRDKSHNTDDPLANYFDSDIHSSRRSSALSHDVQSSRSSLHDPHDFSPKYSQQHFADINFDYPNLKQNGWGNVDDFEDNGRKIRSRSGSVSSIHSAPSLPSYRIVDIVTESTHTSLCHSESVDKLNEIHQMTEKLHIGLKDMSKSIEFLYENMNYKSKKIEHQPLEELSYHRLFRYISKASNNLNQNCWKCLLKSLLGLYPQWFVHRKEKMIEGHSSTTGDRVHECLIVWREYNQSINDEKKITDLKSALVNIDMPQPVIDGIDDIITLNDEECSQYANVLTDQKLSSLALEIGKEWRLLAIFLGHSHQYTERLAMDFQGNSGAAIQKMLFDWREIHNSNVDMLVKAFISVERKDLVEKLYTVYQLIKKSS